MRETQNKGQKDSAIQTIREYNPHRLVQYGSVTQLTQGASGSRADGQGSLGSGNQGSGS